MFAGVGGFRAGLTRVGGFQCVGHCEIDKYAEASYSKAFCVYTLPFIFTDGQGQGVMY